MYCPAVIALQGNYYERIGNVVKRGCDESSSTRARVKKE